MSKSKLKPWTNRRIERAKKRDLKLIRGCDARLKELNDSQLEWLWSWFSDESYCAGWLVVTPEYLQRFKENVFLSPFENAKGIR